MKQSAFLALRLKSFSGNRRRGVFFALLLAALGALAAVRMGAPPFALRNHASAQASPGATVFISSASYAGALGGLAGADQKCQTLADASSQVAPGVWRAIISDSYVSAKQHLAGYQPMALTLVDGAMVAAHIDALWSSSLTHAINQDENGAGSIKKSPWTGTKADGSTSGNQHCSDWLDPVEVDSGMAGLSSMDNAQWIENNYSTCDFTRPLYCVLYASDQNYDITSPQVLSFSLRARTNAQPAVFNWNVSDDQALARVELWRAEDLDGSAAGWERLSTQTVSGTTASGTFTDAHSLGTWWYGIHVIDASGNIGYEPSPLMVVMNVTCTDLEGPNADVCALPGPSSWVCSGGINVGATCSTENNCPIYSVDNLIGLCLNKSPEDTCYGSGVVCDNDADCQKYAACMERVSTGEICPGIELNDSDLSTVCCDRACVIPSAGQLYILGVQTIEDAPREVHISWLTYPRDSMASTCEVTGNGFATMMPSTGNPYAHEVVPVLNAGQTVYQFEITCHLSGYADAVYQGSFELGSAASTLTISDLDVSLVTYSTARVTYGTNIPAIGTVSSCGMGASFNAVSDSVAKTNHQAELTGLSPNTEYCVIVTALATPLTATSVQVRFTTPAAPLRVPDANVVMKVERDRQCKQWLYCRSSVEMKNAKGEKNNFCFDLGVCDTLDPTGGCANPVASYKDLSPSNLTFNTPGEINMIKDLSGYSKIGLNWGDQKRIEGLYPYVRMRERGRWVGVRNGNFETGQASPWRAKMSAELYIMRDLTDSDNNSSHLKIVPGNAPWTGAGVPLGYLSASPKPFLLSFRAHAVVDKNIRVQLGKVGPSSPQYNFVSSAGTSDIALTQSWALYQVRLQTVNQGGTLPNGFEGNAMLQFVQASSSDHSSSAFFIDNVLFQPELETGLSQTIPPQIQTLPRSCRVYPTPEAPACDYLESASGKEYRGWRGYCVERQDPDPLRLNDPTNDCLIWWPVDVLAGDAGVTSSEKDAGYGGRKPLYYCLESSGNYPYYRHKIPMNYASGKIKINRTAFLHIRFNNNKTYSNDDSTSHEHRDSNLSILSILSIHKSELLEVRVKIGRMRVDGYTADVDIDPFTGSGSLDSGKSSKDCYLHTFEKIPNPEVDNPSDRNWNGPSDGVIVFNHINKDEYRWEKYDYDGACNRLSSDIFNQYNYLRCGGTGNGIDNCDVVSGVLKFNSDTQLLEEIEIKYRRDGDPKGTGQLSITETEITYRGERCNVIAQVITPEGDSVPYSSRLSQGGWTAGSGNTLGYAYEQDYEPYGALVLPLSGDPGNPETWLGPAYVEAPIQTGGLKPYQYRAGSPYGILGKTPGIAGGAECITGAVGRLGESCSKSDSCGSVNDEAGNSTPGICAGIEKPSNIIADWRSYWAATQGGVNKGKKNLQDLFVQSYGIWQFNPSKFKYELCDDSGNPPVTPDNRCVDGWNATEATGGSYPQVTNIALSQEPPPVIKRAGGVVLRFTSEVDSDHLPLASFKVDWNDGTPITEVAGLRAEPKSGMTDPHIALHTYECTVGGPGWNAVSGVCEFAPLVQIIDNWGWCGGTGSNGGKGSACAAPYTTGSSVWTPYARVITVEP